MALAKQKIPVLDQVVRRQGLAMVREEIRVVEHNLLIEEENSRSYDPYDNPGPRPEADRE